MDKSGIMIKFLEHDVVKSSDKVIPQGINVFMRQALQNLADTHDAIIAAQVVQTSNANKRRRTETTILCGDLVFLSTKI